MEGEKKEVDVHTLFKNLLLLLLAKILCINGLASLQPHSLTPHRWTNKSGPTQNHSKPGVVLLITTQNQEWSWPAGGCSSSQQWPFSCKVCAGGGGGGRGVGGGGGRVCGGGGSQGAFQGDQCGC